MAVFMLIFSVWMLTGIKKVKNNTFCYQKGRKIPNDISHQLQSKKLYLVPWLMWSTGSLIFYTFASIYRLV